MLKNKIKIEDYTYNLPDEKIAAYPLTERDNSKLLLYNKGIIKEDSFKNLPSFLPKDSIIVFNNTKVVPARLLFRKDTGAFIEIFCLEPDTPNEYNLSFSSTERCAWKCIVGNLKRWKKGALSLYLPDGNDASLKTIGLEAKLLGKEGNSVIIEFAWKTNITFSEVLDLCGKIPIPPYLNRDAQEIDKLRYQTLYAKFKGSVAAPTAGLHFTDAILSDIKKKNIGFQELCLHVGAGTFMPVNTEFVADFVMHSEPFSVTYDFLQAIYDKPDSQKVISVGTTSTRSLESLYYIGISCIESSPSKWIPKTLLQWEPYSMDTSYSVKESIGALIEYMKINSLERLNLRTQIIIIPSYKFRLVDMLITNFHQPQSTLLLLIAAFIGEDWRQVYDYSLSHGFRFLSYGDSSLLIR